ncbi:hypothetical protein Tco_1089425 [Tanacetum coccineum]
MDTKSSVYSFQLDELRFTLDADILCSALRITTKDSAHPFVAPPAGKTSGSDRPRHPILHILWGVITGTNIDYAELIWEEFVQAIKTYFSDAANLKEVDTTFTKGHSLLITLWQMTIHSAIPNLSPKEKWMRYLEWLFLKT